MNITNSIELSARVKETLEAMEEHFIYTVYTLYAYFMFLKINFKLLQNIIIKRHIILPNNNDKK